MVTEAPDGEVFAARDPTAALGGDRARAKAHGDANADLCWLATVDPEGTPSVRTLVLREIDGHFGLFVNATSPKWRAMDAEPRIQISCWFPSLQRQWRMSGSVIALDHEVVARHWHRRPRVSQVLDHLYAQRHDQSSTLRADEDLPAVMIELDGNLPERPEVPRSSLALRIRPTRLECMQINAPPHLHERVCWTLTEPAGTWTRTRLVP